ncbi:NAD-dependent epimerase/dehydratase [Micromonospora sp. L5]|uniref:NAD-dependent epimerase/dehydratase family protein n=1 Tax=Micromonospora sp. (strain L5) TaxID=648999 RepID=UPI0001C45C83|nr:NAD-dependent epimerase/dehydratase family protein [Micromonospora sp. L5]ADU06395.1 NAD-dependent epimerase/dehydratase [Micromonospora sp. L5]
MPEVVVTGGLGFIGSTIVEAYLAEGTEVRIIDSGVSSVVDSLFDDDPRVTVVRAPVEEYLANGDGFQGAERVIHCAARLGPAGILEHAGTLGRDLVVSTSAVIEASLRAKAKLCVFSSAEVYGHSGVLAEDADIRVPANYNARIEYAVGKTLTEVMALNSRYRGLDVLVIRPFNVAGARQSGAGGHVLPTFIRQALAGEPITVFASGTQLRSFCSPTDLAEFVVHHMDAAIGAGVGVVNIGSTSNEIDMMGLAHRVRELAGSTSEVALVDSQSIHGPRYFEAESFRKMPDLTLATELGWKPRVGLDNLILDAIEYARSRQSRDVRHA